MGRGDRVRRALRLVLAALGIATAAATARLGAAYYHGTIIDRRILPVLALNELLDAACMPQPCALNAAALALIAEPPETIAVRGPRDLTLAFRGLDDPARRAEVIRRRTTTLIDHGLGAWFNDAGRILSIAGDKP